MGVITLKHFLLVALIAIPMHGFAGPSSYLCTPKQFLELSDSGEMVPDRLTHLLPLGKQFSVSRLTGQMIGRPFDTVSWKTVSVLQQGSIDNSYKAIVVSHPPNITVMYIQISEQLRIREKPFWGTHDSGQIVSGTCE
jgi:hypothetical protein